MGITRVRIEAEGPNMDHVLDDLNQAFGLLYGSRYIPRESEFIEEVVESHIRSDGAIEYRGRRVMKFMESPPSLDKLIEESQADLNEGVGPVSWVISGNAATSTTPWSSTVWNAASAAAAGASINPTGAWEIRDATGANITSHYTVGQVTGTHPQPWYFIPSAGSGG